MSEKKENTQKINIHKDFLNMLSTEDIDIVASCTL